MIVVIDVNVAMEVVTGLIFFDDMGKGGKTPMSEIASLMNPLGRSMGYQNI